MSDTEKAQKSHISSLLDEGWDTDDILSVASKELFEGLDNDSVSVLAILAKYGICNEYQIGKKGSSPPTNYLLNRSVAWRRIHTYSDYPHFSGLKDLCMVFQRDGSRFRTGKIIHNYGITLKGLMACLQKTGIRFEDCYPICQLCNAVLRWSPNNPSLVQAFLKCMKYDLALFMYSHKVHGFILTRHKDIMTLFLSWNKSNPLVRGELGDLDASLTDEEKDIIRKLQLGLVSSEIVFSSIMRQLYRMSGDSYYAFGCEPHPHEAWRSKYPWLCLQDWPREIEFVQIQDDNDQSKLSLSSEKLPFSDAPPPLDYSVAHNKADKILEAENFKPNTGLLNLVWQGEFYNFEEMEKDMREWLEIFEREEEDKVWSENKDKNLSPDEFRELLDKAIQERVKKDGLFDGNEDFFKLEDFRY